MKSACATLNVPVHSEVVLNPLVSLQSRFTASRFAVSCPGGAEIVFLYMKPFKRHLN